MANEVYHRYTATGSTLYFTIRNTARQMWSDAGTPNFETLTVANWGNYDVAMSESPASSYFYVGTFPAISGNMVAGWYFVEIFLRAGGSAAITDTMVASYFGYWDGTTFKFWADDLQQWKGTTPASLTDTDKVSVSVQHMADAIIAAAKIASDAFTSAKFADGAFTAAKFAASALNGKGDWNIGKTGYSLAAGGMDSVILPADLITGSALAASAVTELRIALHGGDYAADMDANGRQRIVDGTGAGELDTLSGTVLLRAANEQVLADLVNGGRLDLIFDDILADTNELQTDDVPGLIAALNDLSSADVATQAAAALTATVADSVPAAGTRPSVAQACYMFAQYIRNRAISGSSQIIYKPGAMNITPLFTLTMDDADDPTSFYQAA